MATLDWYVRAGMKLRHLQILVALDDLGKTGKVAALFNVSQPAISKAIGELQAGLSTRLFDRTPRGLVPTPSGECLIRHARTLLATLRETGEELHAITHNAPGKIRIGVLPATAAALLPACLVRLKESSPATTVFVREGTMDTLLNELRSGGIEIVVGTLPRQKSGSTLEEEELYGDRTTLVVRPRHPLLRRRTLQWSDMARYPWVLPPIDSLLHDSLMDACRRNGMPAPVNVVETLSVSVIREYLATCDAIASLPESLALRLEAQGVIKPLTLDLPTLVRPVGMIWPRMKAQSLSTKLFMESMRAAAVEFVRPALGD
jgi:DNA-binding transcriptional LysR family regulator